MRKSAISIIALSALSSALTGCQTSAAVEGAGFQHVQLKPGSVNYLQANDADALDKTIANNRACKRARACKGE